MVDVSLPKSLTTIGKKAFYYCSDLKEIKYNGSMEEWNNITKELDWDYYSIKKVICSDGEISL